MDSHTLLVEEDGTIRYVHADDVAELFAGEPDQQTVRVSDVEPAFAYGILGGGWVADMRRVGGPILLAANSEGFKTRQAALDAERQWLRDEKGL